MRSTKLPSPIKICWLIFVLVSFLSMLWIACGLDLPQHNICYIEHIVPLVRRDCSPCHTNGEFRVQLQGVENDYGTIRRYIVPFSDENSMLLKWAMGNSEHPQIWPPSSQELRTLETWINEGAHQECFDEGIVNDGDMMDGDGNDSGDPDGDPDGDQIISFSADIVPLIFYDCTMCHNYGQYGIELKGDTEDYPVIMKYVNRNNPEETGGFLWWAAGGNRHPQSWPVGEPNYNLFLEWVNQGAKNN